MELMNLQSMADDACRQLSPQRFLHVLGVTHCAVALAVRHGHDPVKAAIAGLIHDRSKAMDPSEIEADMKRRGRELEDEDRPFPSIWHGPHAAVYARDRWGLGESGGGAEIAEAIALHSTADEPMGPLAKILFVADSIEPGRSFDGIEEVRRAARRDLDEGFKKALAAKCAYIRRTGRTISPRAVRAMQGYGLGPPSAAGELQA